MDKDEVVASRFGELFNLSARHNAVILLALASTDIASTYLCIKAGLFEANPLVRSFYSIPLPDPFMLGGLIMHLLLYAAITLIIACAAKYLSEINRIAAHTVLIGYSAVLLVVAFNNFFILTRLILRT